MKKKPYYGYPVSIYLRSIPISLFLFLIILALILIRSSLIFIMMMILFFILSLLNGIVIGKIYENKKKITIKKIINCSKIAGNEKILDLGTGLGLVAINMAKNLKKGIVYGIDEWSWLYVIKSRLIFHMIVGSNMYRAKQNAKLENVADKCQFITGNIAEKLNFSDQYFDIICSNESLYFIRNQDDLKNLFYEINRVLKKGGKIILCEPEKSFYQWNIQIVKYFFEELKYDVNFSPIKLPRGWKTICVLVGIKNYI